MNINDLLGLSREQLESTNCGNIVSENNVNSTVELDNVKTQVDDCLHHGLFYFDLSDSDTMTMAIVKVEKFSKFRLFKFRLLNRVKCKEYIQTITLSTNNELVIAYIHENIIKAI